MSFNRRHLFAAALILIAASSGFAFSHYMTPNRAEASLPPVAGKPESIAAAAARGDYEIVLKRIKAGVKPDVNDGLALRWAAHNGHDIVVSVLIEHGANVRILNDAPLREAIQENHPHVVRILLSACANSEADGIGKISRGKPEIQELLKNASGLCQQSRLKGDPRTASRDH